MSYIYVTEEELEEQKQRMAEQFMNRDKRGDTLEWLKAMQAPKACPHCGKHPDDAKEG